VIHHRINFHFLGETKMKNVKTAAAEPTQGPNRAEHGTERQGSVGKDRGQRDVMHTGQPKYIKGIAKKKYNLLADF
jgi:hypothetical protein